MAGRGRGKVWHSNNGSSMNKTDNVNPLDVYNKMKSKFPEMTIDININKWIKDHFVEVVNNPQIAIDVAKYFFVFTKHNDTALSIQIRKSFFTELEACYNEYTNADGTSDAVKYRNFTYFFAASLCYMRNPNSFPLKDIMSALLILISKLDIMEDIEDSIVYSKSVAWLSKFIVDENDGSVISTAFRDAVNKLRELFSLGKGSLISLACLEASLNNGVLNLSAKEFYSKSLPKSEFNSLVDNFTILLPIEDKNIYNLADINSVVFV